jgi:hypothetical protein
MLNTFLHHEASMLGHVTATVTHTKRNTYVYKKITLFVLSFLLAYRKNAVTKTCSLHGSA